MSFNSKKLYIIKNKKKIFVKNIEHLKEIQQQTTLKRFKRAVLRLLNLNL
jgi:hypothetical protein